MPTVVISPATRQRPDLLIPSEKMPYIDAAINGVINERFASLLKVVRGPGKTNWIVSARDPDYLFGFRLMLVGKALQIKSGINTWSMWAEDFTRHTLATRLEAKLAVGGKEADPTPEKIQDITAWLAMYGGDESNLTKLPDDYRRAAGLK